MSRKRPRGGDGETGPKRKKLKQSPFQSFFGVAYDAAAESKEAKQEPPPSKLAEELGLYVADPPPYPSPQHREIDMAMRGFERVGTEGKFWTTTSVVKSDKWKKYVQKKCCMKCERKCASIESYRPLCGHCRFPVEREEEQRRARSYKQVALDKNEKQRLRDKVKGYLPLLFMRMFPLLSGSLLTSTPG